MNRFIKTSFTLSALCFGALTSGTAPAHSAKSISYALEYGVTAAGSVDSHSVSGAYGIVGYMIDGGVVGERSSSGSYAIEPMVGSGNQLAAVNEWVLY